MENNIFVNFLGEVDDRNIGQLLRTMYSASQNRAQLFVLGIASPGGKTKLGMAGYWGLLSTGMNITTHNLGYVDSAAMSLFLAGSRRSAPRGSTFFIHPAMMRLGDSGVMHYGAKALTRMADELEKDNETLLDRLEERTNLKRRQAARYLHASKRFTAEEALKVGIIHSIEEFTLPANAEVILISPPAT